MGKNGYSLRLDGLDRGFNDRARDRAIVMHGAPYVSEAFARAQGRLGRSWGCPALRDAVARDVIDLVKGGGLVFAYYPDPEWLSASKYLGDCAAALNLSRGKGVGVFFRRLIRGKDSRPLCVYGTIRSAGHSLSIGFDGSAVICSSAQ